MIKQILLFDIDRTIFDTDKMSRLRNDIILKILSTSDVEKLNNVKEDYRKTLKNEREYLPEDYLKLLCKAFNFRDFEQLLNVYYGDDYNYIGKECVYPEFFEVVAKLKKDYSLGVFSEGTPKFQNHKFESMGITKYFDTKLIFIVPAKDTLEVVKKLPKDAIVVDDKEKICEFLTKNSIKAIWLNKSDKRKNDSFFATIHNLLDLSEVLY